VPVNKPLDSWVCAGYVVDASPEILAVAQKNPTGR